MLTNRFVFYFNQTTIPGTQRGLSFNLSNLISRAQPVASGMFDPLNHHHSRRSSAVADRRHAVLAGMELMQQRGQDPRAGAAERMSERDGPAERIDV